MWTAFISIIVVAGGIAFRTHAASLHFSIAESITLSSPPATFTIATGSVADALITNATSIAVTLSQTTGGNFTLLSPSYDLSVATSTGGGSAVVSCSGGIETATLSQATGSTVYTITPGGTSCTNAVPTTPTSPSTPIGTGGGGSAYDLSINGGVTTTASTGVMLSLYGTGAYTMEVSNTSDFAGAQWIPYVTSLSWTLASSTGEQTVFVRYRAIAGSIVGNAQASIDLAETAAASPTTTIIIATSTTAGMSVSQLQGLIASLEAQLQVLLSRVSGMTSTSFARDLSFGMTGSDVTALQQFLITRASGPAAAKLSDSGTTDFFGTLTLNALVEFQKKAGIEPAVGYFGTITRKYIGGLE